MDLEAGKPPRTQGVERDQRAYEGYGGYEREIGNTEHCYFSARHTIAAVSKGTVTGNSTELKGDLNLQIESLPI